MPSIHYTGRNLADRVSGQYTPTPTLTPMKNVTIAIPPIYVEGIQYLQDAGVTPSRSAWIRHAVERFLTREIQTCRILDII